jgi:putative tricarboxylic transport membrane protein
MRTALLILAVAGLLLGGLYLAEAMRYPRGALAQPGPGLFPLLVGSLLLLSSAGIGAEAFFTREGRPVDWPAGAGLWRLITVGLATLAYTIVLPYAGHPLAGSLLVLTVLRVMGLRRWGVAVLLALAAGLGSYYLFGVLLGVPLPAGFWGG